VGKATWYGVLLISAAAILPFLAPNYYVLLGALFLYGAANGFLDISMNTLVTEIEKEDRQNFMSAAHGFFSLGGVLAGLGSFMILLLDNPVLHIVLAIILVLVVNAFFYKNYRHIVSPPIEKEPFKLKNFRPLLLIGVVSFVIMGSEGAIVDWSGIFLQEISNAPVSLIGSGFLAFSVTMTLGRFLGDSISAKIGSVKIVGLGALLAIMGYFMVLTTYTLLTIMGFAFIGLGFSAIVPELFRIGGNIKGVKTSQGVAFIAGTGISGFLLGPVILGYLAEASSLKLSFITLLGCCIVVLLATFALGKKK
jgi:fucose permease